MWWWLPALAVAGPTMIPGEPPSLVGTPAPRMLHGTREILPDRGDGTATALVFWAAWCEGCDAALATVTSVRDARGDLGVWVVQVDRDRSVPAPTGTPVIPDPEAVILGQFDLAGLPATVVVDAEGRIRLNHVGPLSPSTLEAAL